MRKSREGGREQVTLGLIVPGKDLVRPETGVTGFKTEGCGVIRISNRCLWLLRRADLTRGNVETRKPVRRL